MRKVINIAVNLIFKKKYKKIKNIFLLFEKLYLCNRFEENVLEYTTKIRFI